MRSIDTSMKYFEVALNKFKTALKSTPDDPILYRKCGAVVLEMISFHRSAGTPLPNENQLLQDTTNYLNQALALRPNDPETLYTYAKMSMAKERYPRAEEYFLQSLEVTPNHTKCLTGYASLLAKMGEMDIANLFYARAKLCHEYDW